ncbi:polyprotein [Phytophthora megakarya]|uniref:Polyprotein n=1 Tax=Phytophthora megakarya TaxID=4795 RepID=A0A225VXX3_9STRA|nr:polyprotein [Phytophthora megakarya]
MSRRGAPTLMVGYASKTKGYRLLDLNTGTISEHRRQNVKFYEQTTVASEYVKKLLNMVYCLRRRPDLDSSKLPFVSLPVSEVPAANDDEASGEENDESETTSAQRGNVKLMSIDLRKCAAHDMVETDRAPEKTKEKEESLEENNQRRSERGTHLWK